eukprot:5762451-Prymnesium_polylepis.3
MRRSPPGTPGAGARIRPASSLSIRICFPVPCLPQLDEVHVGRTVQHRVSNDDAELPLAVDVALHSLPHFEAEVGARREVARTDPEIAVAVRDRVDRVRRHEALVVGVERLHVRIAVGVGRRDELVHEVNLASAPTSSYIVLKGTQTALAGAAIEIWLEATEDMGIITATFPVLEAVRPRGERASAYRPGTNEIVQPVQEDVMALVSHHATTAWWATMPPVPSCSIMLCSAPIDAALAALCAAELKLCPTVPTVVTYGMHRNIDG